MAVTPAELGLQQSDLAEQDQEFELQALFDDAVRRETDHHPELNSRRKRLIFIQETFGWNIVEMAQILGVDENVAQRLLSRRGMRQTEYDELASRFDGTFAITSIIAAHVEGLLPRRDVLNRPNALLDGIGAKPMIKRGEVQRAVFVAERTFRHVHGEI